MNDHIPADHQCPDDPGFNRRRWMAIAARAPAERLEALLRRCDPLPRHTRLCRRGCPVVGLMLVRAGAGGGGAPFNLGEMTVTRCTVRTETGHVGHAYIAGRNETRAELAALVDALMQDSARAPGIEAAVVAPLAAEQAAAKAERGRKAAATRVQFFAMQTMRT